MCYSYDAKNWEDAGKQQKKKGEGKKEKKKKEEMMEDKRWEGKWSREEEKEAEAEESFRQSGEDALQMHFLPRARQEAKLLHRMEVQLPSRAAGQAMTSTFSNFPNELSYSAAFITGLSKIKQVSHMQLTRG